MALVDEWIMNDVVGYATRGRNGNEKNVKWNQFHRIQYTASAS